jgi:hypothetical protein
METLSLKNAVSIACGYSDDFTDDWLHSVLDFFKYVKDERNKPTMSAPESSCNDFGDSISTGGGGLMPPTEGSSSNSQSLYGADRIQQHVKYANNVVQTFQKIYDSADTTEDQKKSVKALLEKSKKAEKSFMECLETSRGTESSSVGNRQKNTFGGLYLVMGFQPLVVLDKVKYCLKLIEKDIALNGTEDEKRAMDVLSGSLFEGHAGIWTDHMLGA